MWIRRFVCAHWQVPLYPGGLLGTVQIDNTDYALSEDKGYTLIAAAALYTSTYKLPIRVRRYGVDIKFMNATTGVFLLWDSDGDVYLRAATADGNAFCSLDFGVLLLCCLLY